LQLAEARRDVLSHQAGRRRPCLGLVWEGLVWDIHLVGVGGPCLGRVWDGPCLGHPPWGGRVWDIHLGAWSGTSRRRRERRLVWDIHLVGAWSGTEGPCLGHPPCWALFGMGLVWDIHLVGAWSGTPTGTSIQAWSGTSMKARGAHPGPWLATALFGGGGLVWDIHLVRRPCLGWGVVGDIHKGERGTSSAVVGDIHESESVGAWLGTAMKARAWWSRLERGCRPSPSAGSARPRFATWVS